MSARMGINAGQWTQMQVPSAPLQRADEILTGRPQLQIKCATRSMHSGKGLTGVYVSHGIITAVAHPAARENIGQAFWESRLPTAAQPHSSVQGIGLLSDRAGPRGMIQYRYFLLLGHYFHSGLRTHQTVPSLPV